MLSGSCLVFVASTCAADEIVDGGSTRTVTSSDPVNNYTVLNGSTLTGTPGARVAAINATSSTVNLTGTVGERMTSRDSTVNLDGVQFSTAGFNAAVSFEQGTGTIGNNSRLINTAGTGLLVTRNGSATTNGANVAVNDSVISGTTTGATVTAFSTLSLTNTQVTGTTGQGVLMRGATLDATGSGITGAQNGIQFLREGTQNAAGSITLSGGQVTGLGGAAIQVARNGEAVINLGNQVQLVGGNGNAIEVIGASSAEINAQNVELAGNVAVSGASTANLSLAAGSLEGNLVNESGSTLTVTLGEGAQLTGQMDNVTAANLQGNSQWLLTADSQVQAMSLAGGTVTMSQGTDFHRLTLGSLSGNGTFVMGTDFAPGLGDFLDVTGAATGTYELLLRSTGTDPVTNSDLQVVHTGAGDATFSLTNRAVDLGAWTYELEQRQEGEGSDWYLNASTRTISPGAQSVMALFNTAPTVWYGELTTLRSRMGELRLDDGQAGGWMRSYGNKYNVAESSGVGYQQVQHGVSLGADASLPYGDGQWLIGLLGGYSHSDLDVARGTSGSVDSFYVGPYVTWLDKQSGYYFDGVVKLNRFRNSANVSLSDGTRAKGDYDNTGLGVSAEFGRHIGLRDGYFVEPFVQMSAVQIQGRRFGLDNGMQADGDSSRSLLGKAGSALGRTIDLGQGRVLQPYLSAALVHEFARNNQVQVNDNTFNNDLSGSRGELGAGVAVNLGQRLQVHADLQYSNGEHIEQPFGATLGLHYSW